MDALGLSSPVVFVDAINKDHSAIPFIVHRLSEDQERFEKLDGGLEALEEERRWGKEGSLTWCVLFLAMFR